MGAVKFLPCFPGEIIFKMPIVKRFSRPCKKCGEMFIPTGRYNFICPKCNPKYNNTFWHRMQRLSRRKKTGAKD